MTSQEKRWHLGLILSLIVAQTPLSCKALDCCAVVPVGVECLDRTTSFRHNFKIDEEEDVAQRARTGTDNNKKEAVEIVS